MVSTLSNKNILIKEKSIFMPRCFQSHLQQICYMCARVNLVLPDQDSPKHVEINHTSSQFDLIKPNVMSANILNWYCDGQPKQAQLNIIKLTWFSTICRQLKQYPNQI